MCIFYVITNVAIGRTRLQRDIEECKLEGETLSDNYEKRVRIQNSTNPKFILR